MEKELKNTYQRLNQDLSKSKYPPEVYFDAQNIRIVAHDRQSLGSVHNIKGNVQRTSIPEIIAAGSTADLYYYTYTVNGQLKGFTTDKSFAWSSLRSFPIGYAVIRKKIIFFSTNEIGEPDGSVGAHWVYDIETDDMTLVYLGVMNYSALYPIDAFGNYENSAVQKVYWLDGNNYFRHMNIADPDLAFVPETNFDSYPEANFETLQLDEVVYSSGGFEAGKVAYTYNYANQNGAQTKVAPITKYFPIAESTTGLLNGELSSATFKLSLVNPDTRFDFIRLYRIFVSLPGAVPVITLVKDEPVADVSTLTMIDDGREEISAITLEQLIGLGGTPKIPYTFGVKDSRIFTANHKETFFDLEFDFRAYRFDNTQEAVIYESLDPGSNSLAVTSANWDTVPEDHSAINWSNFAETLNNPDATAQAALDEDTSKDPLYNTYIYQEDGATIGAEGPNVKISLKTTPIDINTYSNYVYYPDNQDSFLNPLTMDLIGLKRDETYRIAIECYNTLGQTTFAFWVCDFRMPGPTEIPIVTADGLQLNQLQLTFELKTVAVAQLLALGVVGYRILRVERTPGERSVQCQGMISPIIKNAQSSGGFSYRMPPLMGFYGASSQNPLLEPNWQYPYEHQGVGITTDIAAYEYDGSTNTMYYSGSVVEFRSPDLNQSIAPAGYFIAHTAVAVDVWTIHYKSDGGPAVGYSDPYWRHNTGGVDKNYAMDASMRMKRTSAATQYGNPVHLKAHGNILNFDRLDSAAGILNNGTFSQTIINRYAYSVGESGDARALDSVCNHAIVATVTEDGSGVTIGDQLDTEIYTSAADSMYYILADFKRRMPSQYGGPTYADRTRNSYIPSSDYQALSRGVQPITIHGDTYTNMMRYQRSEPNPVYGLNSWADDEKSSMRDLYFIPCESYVAEDLRVRDYIAFSSDGSEKYWTTIKQFHSYNDAYDEQMNERVAVPKPLRFVFPDGYDNEFAYSDKKLPGEFYDSWTAFQTGNTNSVDGVYGPVERIIVNGDQLYFFQHYGYGVWAINPNIAVSGAEGLAVEIGTGRVLHEYKYISTNIGTQNKWSVSGSQFGIVWHDELKKKLMMLAKGAKELNMEGINVWLQNSPTFGNNPILENGIHSVFNVHTNETYITYISNLGSTTWIYSHIAQGFTGKLTNWPNLWIRTNDKLYSASFSATELPVNNIYEFDAGKRGEFNGQVYPSYITIIVNTQDAVHVLNNLRWNSEAYDDGVEQSLSTITAIRIWNDYQDTGLVQLNKNNSRRHLRHWHYGVPKLRGRDGMRAQYHFVQLYYDNLDELEIVLHDITSKILLQYS